MKQIAGVNNWKLVIRCDAAGVAILWAKTCDKRAALPEELFGLPVVALGNHALTPGRPQPAGDEVLITCGPAESDEWDNRQLEELTLPSGLRRVGDYSFFNCTVLKTLRMNDGIQYWGGGVLMNCHHLDTFYVTCSGNEGEILACLADELSRELDVTLYRQDGIARLIFPEYAEIYEENVPHHQFDFHILGAGYSYHHCFYHRKLSFRVYDDLWKGHLAMGHDEMCALRLAWWRLQYPLELSQVAEENYLNYICSRAGDVARWRLEENDAAGLRYLLTRVRWDQAALRDLCDLARRQQRPEILALLLEEQNRLFPVGRNKQFDL